MTGVVTALQLGLVLSYFGQRGWEVAEARADVAVFKRLVLDGHEPDGEWSEVWTLAQVEEAYAAL